MIFDPSIYNSPKWKELSEAEKRLTTYYIIRANHKTLELWPSIKKIKTDTNLCRQSICNANISPCTKGFLHISKERGISNTYTLNINHFGSFYALKRGIWVVHHSNKGSLLDDLGSLPNDLPQSTRLPVIDNITDKRIDNIIEVDIKSRNVKTYKIDKRIPLPKIFDKFLDIKDGMLMTQYPTESHEILRTEKEWFRVIKKTYGGIPCEEVQLTDRTINELNKKYEYS